MSRQKKHTLAFRLQHLAQAIASATDASRAGRPSHIQVESILDFYVDGEKRGEKVQTLYPAIWSHLQSCNVCRASYVLLTAAASDTLPQESDELDTAKPARPLPFLANQEKEAAWTRQVRSAVGGARLGFGFVVLPSYLQQLISAPRALELRGEPDQSARALLLADTIHLGTREVIVKMWIHSPADSPEGRLEVALVASAALPEPIHVTLHWNGHQFSDIVRDGHCSFDHLPISDLRNVRDFRVEFEAGQSQATVEGQHGNSRASA
jgi:hypothetical protein